jgi:hypothetical protein
VTAVTSACQIHAVPKASGPEQTIVPGRSTRNA